MRKTVRTFVWRCDVCGLQKEIFSKTRHSETYWESNNDFPNWFFRHLHFGTDVCEQCKSIIRNAQSATNADPLIDLVNRKQKIQGEQS